jgi:hypothetical protein
MVKVTRCCQCLIDLEFKSCINCRLFLPFMVQNQSSSKCVTYFDNLVAVCRSCPKFSTSNPSLLLGSLDPARPVSFEPEGRWTQKSEAAPVQPHVIKPHHRHDDDCGSLYIVQVTTSTPSIYISGMWKQQIMHWIVLKYPTNLHHVGLCRAMSCCFLVIGRNHWKRYIEPYRDQIFFSISAEPVTMRKASNPTNPRSSKIIQVLHSLINPKITLALEEA